MNKKLKFVSSILLILSLFFASFYIKDFRIDASSDSLVSQNDEDFKYFSYYQGLFPAKNSLVIAINGKNKIDRLLLAEVEKISEKLSKLKIYKKINLLDIIEHSKQKMKQK